LISVIAVRSSFAAAFSLTTVRSVLTDRAADAAQSGEAAHMCWLVLAYAAVGYWHFRRTLLHITAHDTLDTILINAALALTIGPILLIPAALFGWISRKSSGPIAPSG
jgi:hypothetical protein